MSALSLFGSTHSILPRPQLGFPGSLFGELERSLRAMRPELAFAPGVELKRSGDELELSLELPGINPQEDVKLELRNGRLMISGERRREKSEDGYTEFSYGSFSRAIDLPAGVTEEQISASYEAGVLHVRVAGAFKEMETVRRIPISAKSSAESPESLEMRDEESERAVAGATTDEETLAAKS